MAAIQQAGQSITTRACSAGDSGIVQQVFGGQLQSDVICRGCGSLSTVVDPFLDISLEVDPVPKLPPMPLAKASQSAPSHQSAHVKWASMLHCVCLTLTMPPSLAGCCLG